MEFEQLNEMFNQLKLILVSFIREVTGFNSTVFFNENAYEITDKDGNVYKPIQLRADDKKLEIDIKYTDGKIQTLNILTLTNNEIYILCKMLNIFKDVNNNEDDI